MASPKPSHGQSVDGWGIAWPASPQSSVSCAVVLMLVRVLYGWAVELAVLLTLAAGLLAAQRHGLLWLGVLVEVLLAAAVTWFGPVRRWVLRVLRARSVRRAFAHAVRVAAVPALAGQVPAVRRVIPMPAGDRLAVRVPLGATVEALEDAAEILAVALEVRAVRVSRDLDNARAGTVVIDRRDPLAAAVPPWPHAEAERLSLWEPIPVGVDADGEGVNVSLPERNVLLGGEPGAGKSGALSLLVATAALDPTVQLHLFDGKLVELATWAGCATHAVGTDTETANLVLRALVQEMDARYLTLLANRARKVTPDQGLPLHVIVVDELAHYLLAPDRKCRTEFAELMRDLVARGRAAGMIVLAATQKPSHDVIPTALRDLFGFRWAMRCATPQASDTVLGATAASSGYSASDIDAAHRGVGYLLHEGGVPVRLRSHYLDDEVLAAIAGRAEWLRKGGANPERYEDDEARPVPLQAPRHQPATETS